jgi:hypothetical protein
MSDSVSISERSLRSEDGIQGSESAVVEKNTIRTSIFLTAKELGARLWELGKRSTQQSFNLETNLILNSNPI